MVYEDKEESAMALHYSDVGLKYLIANDQQKRK